MLEQLKIHGYRGFSSFALDGLAQVNVILGKNDAGKTSLIEAVEMLVAAREDPLFYTRSLVRRGEILADPRHEKSRLDVTGLFYGRRSEEGARFEISAGREAVSCEVVMANLAPDNTHEEEQSQLALRFSLATRTFDLGLPAYRKNGLVVLPSVLFLDSSKIRQSNLARLWSDILLSPEEERVVDVLRIIEPKIDRIAFTSEGAFLKIKGEKARVSMGSLGDGIQRMLQLALCLANSKSHVLLIDEIETGLHYSAMRGMWKIVLEASERLGVQIFASTHSLDALLALTAVLSEGNFSSSVAGFRIEKNKSEAIRLSSSELVVAMKHEMEIR